MKGVLDELHKVVPLFDPTDTNHLLDYSCELMRPHDPVDCQRLAQLVWRLRLKPGLPVWGRCLESYHSIADWFTRVEGRSSLPIVLAREDRAESTISHTISHSILPTLAMRAYLPNDVVWAIVALAFWSS
jgi:hypothetical protein